MSRECLVEFIFVGSQVDRVALSEHECYMMEDMLFFSSCNVGSSSTSFSSSVLFEGGVFFSKGNSRYLFFYSSSSVSLSVSQLLLFLLYN